MVLFIGLQKYLVALFFVLICASSASLAAANDPGLSNTVAQTMHPTNDSLQNISVGINSDCFTGYFTKLRSVSALERKDMPIVPVSESLEEAAAITLHKNGDKGTWSLAPSLGRYSFNLLDDIKNFQVLLRYRF